MSIDALLDDLATLSATSSDSELAIRAVAVVCVVLGAYLLTATALYALALVARAPRAVRALAWVTPATVRAVAERAVAASLLTATVASPAAAAASGRPVVPPGLRVPSSADLGEELSPALELPIVPHPVPTAPDDEASEPPPVVAPPRSATARDHRVRPDPVTVVRGDHLWGIAARALAHARGADPDELRDGDVAAYWATVVGTNRPRLRSGDPDLIHPGEEIQLPPVPGPTP